MATLMSALMAISSPEPGPSPPPRPRATTLATRLSTIVATYVALPSATFRRPPPGVRRQPPACSTASPRSSRSVIYVDQVTDHAPTTCTPTTPTRAGSSLLLMLTRHPPGRPIAARCHPEIPARRTAPRTRPLRRGAAVKIAKKNSPRAPVAIATTSAHRLITEATRARDRHHRAALVQPHAHSARRPPAPLKKCRLDPQRRTRASANAPQARRDIVHRQLLRGAPWDRW
jgi:hypothetical protein